MTQNQGRNQSTEVDQNDGNNGTSRQGEAIINMPHMFKRGKEKHEHDEKREKRKILNQSRHKKICKMKRKSVLYEIKNKFVNAEDKSNEFRAKIEELFQMKHVEKKSEEKREHH